MSRRTPTVRPKAGAREAGPSDRQIAARIERWFNAAKRDLPWRTTPRDAYQALVSEFMLQQTQVARVLEKFAPFLQRFPTVPLLATAPERDVLAAWSGLGYYRRARNLHAAAKMVMADFAGVIPSDVAGLMKLPGVGRYTAGAIASIVFGKPEPIVDGNVVRVLARLHAKEGASNDRGPADWAWERSAELVREAGSPARFNEGLMELGATVCVPRGPRCGECPLRDLCRARQLGTQDEIPAPKAAGAKKVVHAAAVVVRDGRGQVLVEQRGEDGMWARMWQAPTLERVGGRPPGKSEVMRALGVSDVELVERFTHQTTHREVRFTVWRGAAAGEVIGREWMTLGKVATLGLSNPQRRVLLGTQTQAARERLRVEAPR